jgi:hypothetical protein
MGRKFITKIHLTKTDIAINEQNRFNFTEISSSNVSEITTDNSQQIKDEIISTYKQRIVLKKALQLEKKQFHLTKFKFVLQHIFLFGLIFKNSLLKTKDSLSLIKSTIKSIEVDIDECYIAVDYQFDGDIKLKYKELELKFANLCKCEKVWDVTAEKPNDRNKTRSSVSKIIKRKVVSFKTESLPYVKSNIEAFFLKNANGSNLYFYPSFVIIFSSKFEFAVLSLDELRLQVAPTRYVIQGEKIPKDTEIVDHTWVKVNLNGTRDKRFRNNYKIPIVRYGEIKIFSETGLNEEYNCSNYDFAKDFGISFLEYQILYYNWKHSK